MVMPTGNALVWYVPPWKVNCPAGGVWPETAAPAAATAESDAPALPPIAEELNELVCADWVFFAAVATCAGV